MKTYRFIALAIACMAILSGCKTTEENYRNAYTVAKNANKDASDNETDAKIAQEQSGKSVTVNGTETSVLTNYYKPVDNTDKTALEGKPYGVVVGRFKQIFNARMFRNRLIDDKHNSYLLTNADKEYFVIAEGFATLPEATDYISNIKKNISFTLPITPFVVKNLSR